MIIVAVLIVADLCRLFIVVLETPIKVTQQSGGLIGVTKRRRLCLLMLVIGVGAADQLLVSLCWLLRNMP